MVIGAGHAGLAMSYHLHQQGIEHVILERAEVANSWKLERWDSLRLLTPNWQCQLPGQSYAGDQPDAYMTVAELIRFIEEYAHVLSAPVRMNTRVISLKLIDSGYLVETDRDTWQCRTVVIASGACNKPAIPVIARDIPDSVTSLSSMDYRRPQDLEDGGVLVVGASATGTQLAGEIHRSGRPVTLAVGEHVRLPRTYRGRDILWWMNAAGILDERFDEVDDIVRARNIPSPQLTGSPTRHTEDLNSLSSIGIRLVGRLAGINGTDVQFSGSLRNNCSLADLKMNRLLNTIDEWAAENGHDSEEPERFKNTRVENSPPLVEKLVEGNIRTILWATGYRPDYTWLNVPVLDRKGRIRHDGGVVDSPGMYLMGMNFLRRRKSSFIHGAGDDARDLSQHLVGYLG